MPHHGHLYLLHDIITGISTKLSITHESSPDAMRCEGYTPMRQTCFKSGASKSDATTQIDDLTGNIQPTPSYETTMPYYWPILYAQEDETH